MNKLVLGILLGGILGIFDGLTAWFTPEVRAHILEIVIGSTMKGLIRESRLDSLPGKYIRFRSESYLVLPSDWYWHSLSRICKGSTTLRSCCQAGF